VKLHVEANVSVYLDIAEELTAEEAAAYRALTTDEERTNWLKSMASEITLDNYTDGDREIYDLNWRLEDDD
jgi:hypothetical protein